jgi:hypothetical protein
MRRVLGVFLLVMAAVVGSAAGQNKTGTSIAQFLGIEPSARHAAMGNAGVALFDGIESVYYNPAALGGLPRTSVQLTHSEWFADINYDYAAVALPIGTLGTFFGSVTALNSGDIEVRTETQPLGTGERFTVGDVAIGLGYGRRITPRFAAGAQINYVNERIWHTSSKLVTFNVGTLYTFPLSGLRIGSSLSNVGTRSRFTGRDLAIQFDNDPDVNGDNSALPGEQFTEKFPVPLLFRVGVTLPTRLGEASTLILSADAFHPSDNTEYVSAGAEWSYRNTIDLRAGYQNLFQSDSELGPTLGVGIRGIMSESQFQLNYAWAGHERLAETHRMTFVLAL